MLGGFLKQMNDTMKYNRDILGKTKRKPFEKQDIRRSGKAPHEDEKRMTEAERSEFIRQLQVEARRQRRRQLLILILSVGGTALIIFLLNSSLVSELLD